MCINALTMAGARTTSCRDTILRIGRVADRFTFTDETRPGWSVRLLVGRREAHATGADGEHCFKIGAQRASVVDNFLARG